MPVVSALYSYFLGSEHPSSEHSRHVHRGRSTNTNARPDGQIAGSTSIRKKKGYLTVMGPPVANTIPTRRKQVNVFEYEYCNVIVV